MRIGDYVHLTPPLIDLLESHNCQSAAAYLRRTRSIGRIVNVSEENVEVAVYGTRLRLTIPMKILQESDPDTYLISLGIPPGAVIEDEEDEEHGRFGSRVRLAQWTVQTLVRPANPSGAEEWKARDEPDEVELACYHAALQVIIAALKPDKNDEDDEDDEGVDAETRDQAD